MLQDHELPYPVGDERFKIYRRISTMVAIEMYDDFCVETKEGRIFGKKGDYLCYGGFEDKWLVKKEIFERTYEVIDEPEGVDNNSHL